MYFTYQLIDPFTSEPFYIGKGTKNRPLYHLQETADNTYNRRKFNKIQKIRKQGKEPIVDIIEYFENEQDAYAAERNLIAATPNLTNINPGGEGGKGNDMWKINNPSTPNKGRKYDDIYGAEKSAIIREKRSNKLKGRSFNTATLSKMSASAKLRDHSYKEKMVYTPQGIFKSAQEAAIAFQVSPGTVTYRSNSSSFNQWFFI